MVLQAAPVPHLTIRFVRSNELTAFVLLFSVSSCEKDQNNDVIVGNATNGGHCYSK